MAIHRFHLLNSKKTNHIKLQKKEIASLLAAGKEEKARIRVEHVIRMASSGTSLVSLDRILSHAHMCAAGLYDRSVRDS